VARPGLVGGQYSPLSQGQIEHIHLASLSVLETTGIQVQNDEALRYFRQGGARIQGDRAYISVDMVADALASVPATVLLAGRESEQDVLLEGKRVYAGTGGSPTSVLDPGATTFRRATLQDLVDLVRVADGLEHCDFIVVPLHPTDIPEEDVPVNRYYACLTSSTKHVMGGVGSVEGARAVIEMGCLIAGGLAALQERPFISAIASWMVSPLHLDTGVTDTLIEWCKHGLPIALSSAPMAGSTSPVTLAGTLIQLNAEQLCGIVLSQLVRPGTPVLAGYIPGVADMRSGGYLGGAVEFGLMQAAAAQLAAYYRVPIYCSGGMTDSKVPDAQAGYEKMSTFLLAALAGANFIHHAIGMLADMSATALEQAVIDDEIVGMAMRVLRGLDVTADTVYEATEAIDRVGPGGHFLMDPHTLRFMRSEFFYPVIADRTNSATWEEKGRVDVRARATDRVVKLLAEQKPPGLPQDIDAAIRSRFKIWLRPAQ
jgi:trimethylamine--corrinoid protein Co-methyltransferase